MIYSYFLAALFSEVVVRFIRFLLSRRFFDDTVV